MTVSNIQSSEDEITVIEPLEGWVPLNLRELWNYRELLFFMVWRDVTVRYKQTVLGATWAILQPVMTMVVFSVFFGKLAKIPSNGVPYPIFSYTALLPWVFFSAGVGRTSNIVVSNTNLIKKVYFPRLILPIASVLGGIVDFALSFLVLIGMMLYYGIYPRWEALILLLPFLLLALIISLGVGLWFGALNAQYRDIRYLVPFLVQFWMYATPVIYPTTFVPENWRMVYSLNPMAGVVEVFRWVLLNRGDAPDPLMITLSVITALVILITGMFYFRRMEKNFADVV
ncbi:MAG TPA: ABC transporter permease [Aggregatilineaceae bacterium]|nr:ABC transporter permease [Aggregatilineaceae bacterium]